MRLKHWLAFLLLYTSFGGAMRLLANSLHGDALGLPADFWKGLIQMGTVVVPLAVLGGVFLAKVIVARAQPKA